MRCSAAQLAPWRVFTFTFTFTFSYTHTHTHTHAHTPMLTTDEAQWVREEERIFDKCLFPALAAKEVQVEAEADADADACLREATKTEEAFGRLLVELFARR